MVSTLKICMLFYLCVIFLDYCYSQNTYKDSGVLIRKRRYLGFPKGANFVYTVVYVKILMQKVPKGVQFLHEFDVPHPLPQDTRIFRRFKHGHHMHRRQLFEDIVTSLNRYGLNGTACVNRIVCETKQFIPFKGKSLVKDILVEIFLGEDELKKGIFEESCEDYLTECPHPLLELMWGSFTNY